MKYSTILDYLAWTLLGISIILLRTMDSLLENIVCERSFVICFLSVGLAVAGLFFVVVYKIHPAYFRSGEEKRGSAVLSYIFAISILTLFLAAFYSKNTGLANTYTQRVLLERKSQNTRYKTLYFRLRISSDMERFTPSKCAWEDAHEGDSLWVILGRGPLGYDHALSFESPK